MDEILKLLDLSIDKLAEALPAATLPELLTLLDAEAKGKTRKGAVAAIVQALTAPAGFEIEGLRLLIVDQSDFEAAMETMGYPHHGGPEDVSIAGKALLALRGVSSDREDLRGQIEGLATTILELELRGTESEGACGVAAIRLRELKGERDQLAAALDGAKDDILAAQAVMPRKARPIGPIETPLDVADLAELIGGDVQIVFSDGESEIVAIDPVKIGGSHAWVRRGTGFMLRTHLTVKGPAYGDAAYGIAGFGLIAPDGEQVAWCALPNLVPVGGGQQVQFRDSILFG